MPGLKELLESCDADLRGHLLLGERVIAVGRCEDVTDRGDLDRGGAGWTFVMVTDRRLRWVPRSLVRYETDADLDEITDAFEQRSAHRYAIRLHHSPIRALRDVPAHRFMTFRWGSAIAARTLSRTTIAFSRRDTEAARALREQLALRGVVPRVVPSPPRKPREPPQYLVLRPDDQ